MEPLSQIARRDIRKNGRQKHQDNSRPGVSTSSTSAARAIAQVDGGVESDDEIKNDPDEDAINSIWTIPMTMWSRTTKMMECWGDHALHLRQSSARQEQVEVRLSRWHLNHWR